MRIFLERTRGIAYQNPRDRIDSYNSWLVQQLSRLAARHVEALLFDIMKGADA